MTPARSHTLRESPSKVSVNVNYLNTAAGPGLPPQKEAVSVYLCPSVLLLRCFIRYSWGPHKSSNMMVGTLRHMNSDTCFSADSSNNSSIDQLGNF